MSEKYHGKMTGRSAKAILLMSCMLACALSPVITTWDDEDSSASISGDSFRYVSLGDSMVAGYGMGEYYYDNGTGEKYNCYGFETKASNIYPTMIAKELSDLPGFEFNQLAISGMRSADLRTILDEGFPGDWYSNEGGDYTYRVNKAIEKAGDDIDNYQEFRDYYLQCLADADIISYQYLYDIGYILTRAAFSMVNEPMPEMDFSLYIDEEILNAVGYVKEELGIVISDVLASQGYDIEDYAPMIGILENIMNASMYGLISYCANFDANMEIIHELNPDAKILVLDCYNTFEGIDFIIGDYEIPLGKIYGVLLDAANLYTKYLSPASCYTTHVDIDGYVEVFYDEFKSGDKTKVSSDAKAIVGSILGEKTIIEGNTAFYDSVDTYGNLTAFLQAVFNTKDLDVFGIVASGMSLGEIESMFISKVMAAMTLFPTEDCQVISDENGCIVTDGTTTVEFAQSDLSFLWVYFAHMSGEAALGHPGAAGHTYIYETIMAQEVLYNNVALGSLYMPTEPSENGNLVSLVDVLEMATANPEHYAEALGLDISDVALPLGARLSDINYLLGGTDFADSYTLELVNNASADMGLTVNEYRQYFQSAVAGSSAVLVSSGANNFLSGGMRIADILNGADVEPLDLTIYESINPEFYAAVMDIRAGIDDILTSIFGEGSEATELYNDYTEVVDTVLYETLGYAENYGSVIDTIRALSADTKIIVVGPANILDGCTYTDESLGIDVDVGAISGALVEAINAFNESQVSGDAGVVYVDMSDKTSGEPLNLATISSIDQLLETVMDNVVLSEGEIETIVGNIQGEFSAFQYSVTFDFVDGTAPIEEAYNFGAIIEEPATIPVRNGMYFVGWDVEVPETMPAYDLAFTAQWAYYTCTIVYDANGGNGTMADQVVEYGADIVLDDNAFTRSGYTFAGWNTATDGTGIGYTNGQNIDVDLTSNNVTLTLYAQWDVVAADHGDDEPIETPPLLAIAIVALSVTALIATVIARRL